MSVFSGAPLRRLWIGPQATFNLVPNSSGTYTATGAKTVPYTKADIKRNQGLIEADAVKAGTGSSLAGIAGRLAASGSFSTPLMPSGAAGTAPNLGLLLKNIFGVETVSASTSVTYTQADTAVAAFIAALFNESDSASTMQFAYGGFVTDFTLNLGGDGFLGIDSNAQFVHDLESDNWANETTATKGGLTTYPAEPGSPSIAGNFIPSFLTSTISIGGNSPVEFVSGQINGVTGRKLRYDGGLLATAYVQGKRKVSLKSLKLADSNGSGLAAIKNLAGSKAAGDVVIVQGGVAGYTITHTLKSVQLGNFSFTENGEGLDITFDDSPAHASAIGSINDYQIVLT